MEQQISHYKALVAESHAARLQSDAHWNEQLTANRSQLLTLHQDNDALRAAKQDLLAKNTALSAENLALSSMAKTLQSELDSQAAELASLRVKGGGDGTHTTAEASILLLNLQRATRKLCVEVAARDSEQQAAIFAFADYELAELVDAYERRPAQFKAQRGDARLKARIAGAVSCVYPSRAFADAVLGVDAAGAGGPEVWGRKGNQGEGGPWRGVVDVMKRFEAMYSENMVRLGFMPEQRDLRWLPHVERFMDAGEAEKGRWAGRNQHAHDGHGDTGMADGTTNNMHGFTMIAESLADAVYGNAWKNEG